ncbi:MAG: hypothetical protein KF746_21040 [Chitinophagaceae bacterium]|nr:hypothetical protein [Chitinophagaceae bacterium]
MFTCQYLKHPFQNDPGVSQRQRAIDELLSDNVRIDGRSTAELLQYIFRLSRNINYYETDMSVSDWQPLFRNSLPFLIAEICTYDTKTLRDKFRLFGTMFSKQPGKPGLQLLLYYMYYHAIGKFNDWQLKLAGKQTGLEAAVRQLIGDTLRSPVRDFIAVVNTASRIYGVKRINIIALVENETWQFTTDDLRGEIAATNGAILDNCKNMQQLKKIMDAAFASFMNAIESLSLLAPGYMEASLEPEKEALQKSHAPHLALIFAFIKLFGRMQGELNKKTRRHLDFFYKEVLNIRSAPAQPDKAHIVFELQKILRNELQKYALPKGTLLKDGKDDNKQEILFSTDEEIVVNEAQIVEKKTLFLNQDSVPFETRPGLMESHTYVGGVYMAPKADMADGVKEDFSDGQPVNWYTLGNKDSKFIAPGKKDPIPYPGARLGFILASPVLYLAEGTRTIDIKVVCKLDTTTCGTQPPYPPENLMEGINKILSDSYILINEDIIDAAVKKGLSENSAKKIREYKDVESNAGLPRYCHWIDFLTKNSTVKNEVEILPELFYERHALSILFSGEKEWIKPSSIDTLKLDNMVTIGDKGFDLLIKMTLKADRPGVVFFNKETLKEDFNTTLPLVKIELDPAIKLEYEFKDVDGTCCLERRSAITNVVSMYHFFRAARVQNTTEIRVDVCGVKNLVVQNDENVMDVNAPIYPFGTRPDVADFDVVNPSKAYCFTRALVEDVVSNGISKRGENALKAEAQKKARKTKKQFDDFLKAYVRIENEKEKPEDVKDRAIIQERFKLKNYCPRNLRGPNFYLGSKEIFFKAWETICIKLNWKDKPESFNDHYLAYVKREDYFTCDDPTDATRQVFGLNECEFEVNFALLEEGNWKKEKDDDYADPNPVTGDNNRKLFTKDNCKHCDDGSYEYSFKVENDNFDSTPVFVDFPVEFNQYTVHSRHGFLKLNLQNQDFLHKNYAFVLARQMMAFGKLPSKQQQEGAVYYDPAIGPYVFDTTFIKAQLEAGKKVAGRINIDINDTDGINDLAGSVDDDILKDEANDIRGILRDQSAIPENYALTEDAKLIEKQLTDILSTIGAVDTVQAIIPNEPWTPIISNIALDYTATATVSDTDLIHLHPYPGTYKHEEIELKPSLFPVFCDEGNLFIGLKDLVPGSNLNMLFQLAEATANSEADSQDVLWHYLTNNNWKPLRIGFELLNDGTGGLTTSGIIKFSIPGDISTGNSILPKEFFWIKAATGKNSKAVSETINIYAQAVSATFTNTELNDKKRLAAPLQAGRITKLHTADPHIKKVNQFYETFGGQVNEDAGPYYTRVSELLRHKSRAIQKWDYERLVLEKFPLLYKAKCINHSFKTNADDYISDIPYAPGYVLLAVIPDLNKLKAGNSFEPKAPVSVLQDIELYFRSVTSPFVRLRAVNPRYEKIFFSLKVQFVKGVDKKFYEKKLEADLRYFMAPWAIGKYDKLSFGQILNRSDIIRFLESTEYIDYILKMEMKHEEVTDLCPENDDDEKKDKLAVKESEKVLPQTPRSILVAGKICVKAVDSCDKWCTAPPVTGKQCNQSIPITTLL